MRIAFYQSRVSRQEREMENDFSRSNKTKLSYEFLGTRILADDDEGYDDGDACKEDGSMDEKDESENGFSFKLPPQFSSQPPFTEVGQRGNLKMCNHLDFQVRYFMLTWMLILCLL